MHNCDRKRHICHDFMQNRDKCSPRYLILIGQGFQTGHQLMMIYVNTKNLVSPASWFEAFDMLTKYLTPIIKRQRRVVFFDEFPWTLISQ
jgi:hypothetical protein